MADVTGPGATPPPPPPPPPGISTAPTAADINRNTDAIAADVKAMHDAQSATRWAFLGTSLAIILLFVIFGLLIWNSVSENLSQENVQREFQERIAVEMPKYLPLFRQALMDVEPEYRERAMQSFENVAPQLQEKVAAQVQALPEELRQELSTKLNASLEDLRTKLMADLQQKFPRLTQEQLKSIGDQLQSELQAQAPRVAERLQDMLRDELEEMNEVIEKFPLPPVEHYETVDLQKAFVHNLIMLADYELLATGTNEALMNPDIPISPGLGGDEPIRRGTGGDAGTLPRGERPRPAATTPATGAAPAAGEGDAEATGGEAETPAAGGGAAR